MIWSRFSIRLDGTEGEYAAKVQVFDGMALSISQIRALKGGRPREEWKAAALTRAN